MSMSIEEDAHIFDYSRTCVLVLQMWRVENRFGVVVMTQVQGLKMCRVSFKTSDCQGN